MSDPVESIVARWNRDLVECDIDESLSVDAEELRALISSWEFMRDCARPRLLPLAGAAITQEMAMQAGHAAFGISYSYTTTISKGYVK